ncbi:MAG: TMEM165/GDT1 family protein [Betaproteobacteria bacterium]
MEALFVSAGLVALAEIGDKTQLLSLVLAARFRQPWTIALGIGLATLANHALAAALGAWIGRWLGPDLLPWILGASFLAMAVWMLIPDRLEGDEAVRAPALGVLATTVVVFFLAEMGDKTQVATVVLAARYEALIQVVLGTTAGMMLANGPVVFLGERLTRRLPMTAVRRVSAGIFVLLALLAFLLPPSALGA